MHHDLALPLGISDLKRSPIVKPTPWNAHITAYKKRDASAAMTSQEPNVLLTCSAKTHVFREQVCTAQRDEIVRIAAENEALRRIHNEVGGATRMPLYKLRDTVDLTE
jgi:hypothetical protein